MRPEFRSRTDEEEWKQKQIQAIEDRKRYLGGLFYLPGVNLKEPEWLVHGLLPQGYLAIFRLFHPKPLHFPHLA